MADVAHTEAPVVEPMHMNLDDAAAAMPDSAFDDIPAPQPEPRQPDPEPVTEEAKTEDAPEKEAASVEDTPTEEELSYIELPAAEEGGEPTRIELDQAIERYQAYEELQSKVENLEKTQLPPTDWDQYSVQHVQGMQQLDDVIQQWQMANPIQDPDPSMALEDPEGYVARINYNDNLREQHRAAFQARQQAQQEIDARQGALDQVLWQREQAKIFEKHPQLKEQAAVLELAKDLQSYYGVKPETLNEVRNSQAFDIILDAIAFRKSKGQHEVVAKAVKAKPRLVKSHARDGSTPKQRAQSQARERLAETGSLADAAEALDAFL